MGHLLKYRDIVSASVMTAISWIAYRAVFDIKDVSIYAIGPRQVPMIITLGMLAMSLICLLLGIVNAVRRDFPPLAEKSNYAAVGLTMALLLAYAATMNRLGFIVASILYLFLQFQVLATGRRRHVLFLALSAGVTFFIYLFFRYVLLLMLPGGLLRF